MLRLTRAELDAALSLTQEGGLSELLPPFFEVAALTEAWQKVRPILESVDLDQYEPHPSMTLLGPKQKYVVRPIQLLDPIDTILYSGLARRIAPAIESSRTEGTSRSVFSYRFSAKKANEFTLTNSYDDFKARIVELCSRYSHVAVADIADFFPNIYLHRLTSAVASLGFEHEARTLERWLSRWSTADATPTSYGLPVGQLASNVLAEALLVQVDVALARDYEFVRYVDDYYIFCESQSSAFAALHGLSQRLLQTERLHLNMAKTRIREAGAVREDFVTDQRDLRSLRDQFIAEALHGDPYGQIEPDEMTPALAEFIEGIDARRMLRESLTSDMIDLKAVGFALQVLGATRDASAANDVLSSLSLLGAASRQVGNYLVALAEQDVETVRSLGERVLSFVANDSVFKTPYQIIWLLEPFTRSAIWDNAPALMKLALRSSETLVRRQALLGASQSKSLADLLDLKSAVSDNRWLQRAALFGARYLPESEREHFWRVFDRGDWTIANCLQRSVIQYARRELERARTAFDPDEIPF